MSEEGGLAMRTAHDAEQLRQLAIAHYVVGGLMALVACFPMIHLAIGLMIATGAFGASQHGEAPPRMVGWLFAFVAGGAILLGWVLAACTVFAGRSIAQRKRHLYCLIVAGVMAVVCVPFGSILGAFTIIVLVRPTVKQEFGAP
jgi:hypothetical protein